jgi:hypothetical protein
VSSETAAILYLTGRGIGFHLIITSGAMATRIIKARLQAGFFNKGKETFPQEERLPANEYSINLPDNYNIKARTTKICIK